MKKNQDNLPPSELMAKPALSWHEFFVGILGLPKSTAELIAKRDNAPKFFLIGRRRYIRKSDAIDWIDSIANSSPYFPRRNRLRTAKVVST